MPHLCLWVVLQVVWAIVSKQVLHPWQQQLVGCMLLHKHAKLTQPSLHDDNIISRQHTYPSSAQQLFSMYIFIT
jgi:hypothetical protein